MPREPRSLEPRGISALSAPPARILARASDCAPSGRRDPASRVVPPRSASGAWRHARLALPVRQGDVCRAGYRTINAMTACATYFIPGGLKGRGPLAVSRANGVACAGSIRASAARCGCPSENIPLSDRQRPEGFQRITSSAVPSAVEVSLTATPTEITDNFAHTVNGDFDSTDGERNSPRTPF